MTIKEIKERLALVDSILDENASKTPRRITNSIRILRELRLVSDELIYEYDRLHERDKGKSLRHRCLSEASRYEEAKEQATTTSDNSPTTEV